MEAPYSPWTTYRVSTRSDIEDISKKITFPYYDEHEPSALRLFEKLKADPISVTQEHITLSKFYNNYRAIFGLYLPPLLNGRNAIVKTSPQSYINEDVITDYYFERFRMSSRLASQARSPMELWNDQRERFALLEKSIINKEIATSRLKELIESEWKPIPIFRPSWIKAILREASRIIGTGKRLRVLDPLIGYGERFVAAISLGMTYTGYDPNQSYTDEYTGMAADLASSIPDVKINTVSFETSTEIQEVDIVFFSPILPGERIYANRKIGIADDIMGMWLELYLFPSLYKAWKSISNGGILILDIHDTSRDSIVSFVNLFIEKMLEKSSWQGTIIVDEVEQIPVWVWRKTGTSNKVVWNKELKRSIEKLFPTYIPLISRYFMMIRNPMLYRPFIQLAIRMIEKRKNISYETFMNAIIPILPFLMQEDKEEGYSKFIDILLQKIKEE